METNGYPRHPGQTSTIPQYVQLPLDEYECLMQELFRLKDTLKRHGITLLEAK